MIKSCNIVNTGGAISVFNTDGSFSELYAEALNYAENVEDAVKLWSYTQTELWEQQMGTSDNVKLPEVLRFLENLNSLEIKPPTLSKEQTAEVANIMQSLNIETVQEFATKMNNLFNPSGIFEINRGRLLKSGLYDNSDIDSLSIPTVKDFLAKLNIFANTETLSVLNDTFPSTMKFKDLTAPKNSLGFNPFVTMSEIALNVADITDDFSKKSLERALAETEFSDGLDSKTFMNNLFNFFSNKKKVYKFFVNGSETQTTVENTLLEDIPVETIEEQVDFLNSILPEVWEQEAKNIQSLLTKTEKYLASQNIDVIGLSGNFLNRDGVLGLMNAVQDLITTGNAEDFARLKDELTQDTTSRDYTLQEVSPARYKNYTLLNASVAISQDDLFETQGMIKVGDDLYHQVSRDNTVEELYEELYQRVVEGSVIVDEKYFNNPGENLKDPLYENEVKESLEKWINSRQTGIKAPVNAEEISLYQVLFNHDALQDMNTYSELSGEFSEEYLKGAFVSDFYNYKLQEKLKGSDVYNKTLQYFNVGDGDIVYSHPTNQKADLRGIKFEKALQDYANLKKEGSIKMFAVPSEYVNEDAKILNNLEQSSEIHSADFYVGSEGYLTTKGVNSNTYLKQGGKFYRKLFDDTEASIYKEVASNVSPIYNDLNLDFSYNLEVAKEKMRQAYDMFTAPQPKPTESISKQTKLKQTIELESLGTYTDQELNSLVSNYINEEGTYDYNGKNYETKQRLVKQLELEGVLEELIQPKLDISTTYGSYTQQEIEKLIEDLTTQGELTYTNEEGLSCASVGMKIGKGGTGKWVILEDLKGEPSHKLGGVDLEFSPEGVSFINAKNLKVKAENGLLITPEIQ